MDYDEDESVTALCKQLVFMACHVAPMFMQPRKRRQETSLTGHVDWSISLLLTVLKALPDGKAFTSTI